MKYLSKEHAKYIGFDFRELQTANNDDESVIVCGIVALDENLKFIDRYHSNCANALTVKSNEKERIENDEDSFLRFIIDYGLEGKPIITGFSEEEKESLRKNMPRLFDVLSKSKEIINVEDYLKEYISEEEKDEYISGIYQKIDKDHPFLERTKIEEELKDGNRINDVTSAYPYIRIMRHVEIFKYFG